MHEVLVKVGDEDVLLGGDDAESWYCSGCSARGEDLSRHGQESRRLRGEGGVGGGIGRGGGSECARYRSTSPSDLRGHRHLQAMRLWSHAVEA